MTEAQGLCALELVRRCAPLTASDGVRCRHVSCGCVRVRPTVVRCESVMSYRGVPYAAVRVMWLVSVSVDVETNVPYA